MKIEAKRSQIDLKTSAAAKITADIKFLLNDRHILQKNLDEFLIELAKQQREDTLKKDKEIMTCKKRKYDSAGTSASSEFTQEQWKDMFHLNSDSSSEEEMEMQRRNTEHKNWRDDESLVERMHIRIEAAFNCSGSDSDDPSQDPNFRIHTNIEGLADRLYKLLASEEEELKECKAENDDVGKNMTREFNSN